MNEKTRFVIWAVLVNVLWLPAASPVHCDAGSAPAIRSEAAVLLDAQTGRTLFAVNPDKRMPPASLAKMMTLYLAFDALERGDVAFDDEVVVSARAWKMGGSQMFLEVGDRVPLLELIKGAAVVSANDAALAIAEFLAGSEETFVDRMNEKARALGMADTHFVNPHGLPRKGQNSYTSAAAMATLGFHYLTAHPDALKFHSLPMFTYRGIEQKNWNALLRRDRGVNGLKTGYLRKSGYHVLFSAEQNNQSLVGAVMGGAKPAIRNQDALNLLAYGFDNYSTRAVVTAGEVVATVKVARGDPLELELTAATTLMVTVRKDPAESVPLRKEIPTSLKAPISRGSRVGKLVLQGEGFPPREVALIAGQDIAIKSYATRWGIGLGAIAVLLCILVVKRRASGKKRPAFRFESLF